MHGLKGALDIFLFSPKCLCAQGISIHFDAMLSQLSGFKSYILDIPSFFFILPLLWHREIITRLWLISSCYTSMVLK